MLHWQLKFSYDAKGYPDRNIFAPPLKFAIFANMMDDNRTITYVSDSTSRNYSDYLWITSRASEVPTPTDMAIEKSEKNREIVEDSDMMH